MARTFLRGPSFLLRFSRQRHVSSWQEGELESENKSPLFYDIRKTHVPSRCSLSCTMSQSQNKSRLCRQLSNTPESSSDDEGEASSRGRQGHPIAPIALGTAAFTPIPFLHARPRASSLPPSSDGPTPSSPIVGTKAEQRAIVHRKSQRKRLATLKSKKTTQVAEEEQ